MIAGNARDEILLEIMEHGWNHEIQSFVQSYGSDVLDASLLQLLPAPWPAHSSSSKHAVTPSPPSAPVS